MVNNQSQEANAFNERIQVRLSEGFIPDLRKLKKNEYFYKSFWRDPLFADLYVGEISRIFISLFRKYLPNGSRILDAGCGPGYFALELARSGFEVVGTDIASEAISAAQSTYLGAKHEAGIAPVRYLAADPRDLLEKEPGIKYDGILCSGFLHHIPDVQVMVECLSELLTEDGVLVIHEPQHSAFTQESAFWISVVRNLLVLTENWYQEKDQDFTKAQQTADVESVLFEYKNERDLNEPEGQSPNDLSCDRKEILIALSKYFDVLEDFPSRSFIYRTLGGLRGEDSKVEAIAKYLTLVDSLAVELGFLDANYFFCVLKKSKTV